MKDYKSQYLCDPIPSAPFHVHDYRYSADELGRNEIDYCPYCKRDIFKPERPFNLKEDNHLDKCVHGRGFQR